jgi:hypothetical protein
MEKKVDFERKIGNFSHLLPFTAERKGRYSGNIEKPTDFIHGFMQGFN